MARYQEENVFNEAIDALRENYATFPVHLDVMAAEKKYGTNMRIDKIVNLTFGKKQMRYFAEIKNNITKAYIALTAHRRNILPGPMLLITDYVNNAMVEYLKEQKIEFIDAAGNAYLNQPPVHILIKGNKPEKKHAIGPTGQVFRPTGLKVVFTILCNTEAINKNYRLIAQAAGVALGNIGWIIADLKRLGIVIDMGKRGRRIVQKQRLLEHFVEEYPKKLRQQLLLGRFAGDQDWWKRKNKDFGGFLWGGEIAAAKMGNYLKPQTVTIYLKQDLLNEFLLKNRLKKDAKGEVEILRIFWNFNKIADPNAQNIAGHKNLTNPILAYADLMATGIQRNIEAAKEMYEQYLKQCFRED